MRKILLVLGLASCVLLYGWAGSGWRGARTLAGDYTFSGAIDADSTNTDHLVVNTSTVLVGNVDLDGGNLLVTDGQKLIATDDTEADSISVYDNGTYSIIAADNTTLINQGVIIDGAVICSSSVTIDDGNLIVSDGQKAVWTDDSKADSISIYDDGTSAIVSSDNAMYFTNLITGTDSILDDNTQDTIYNEIFGTAAFIVITPLEAWGDAGEWYITTKEDTVFVNIDADANDNVVYKWVLIKP